MSRRTWFAACAISFIYGVIAGWALRVGSMDDRALRNRIADMEARIRRNNTEAEAILAEAMTRIEREHQAPPLKRGGREGLQNGKKTH